MHLCEILRSDRIVNSYESHARNFQPIVDGKLVSEGGASVMATLGVGWALASPRTQLREA